MKFMQNIGLLNSLDLERECFLYFWLGVLVNCDKNRTNSISRAKESSDDCGAKVHTGAIPGYRQQRRGSSLQLARCARTHQRNRYLETRHC